MLTARPDYSGNLQSPTRHDIQLQRPQKKRSSTWVTRRWMTEYPHYHRKVSTMLWLHTLYLLMTSELGLKRQCNLYLWRWREEARQETVRIIKSSSRPRDNLTRAEKEALRTLKEKHQSHHPTGRQKQCNRDSQHCGLQTEDHLPSWGSVIQKPGQGSYWINRMKNHATT